jgi:hypothetical protein
MMIDRMTGFSHKGRANLAGAAFQMYRTSARTAGS